MAREGRSTSAACVACAVPAARRDRGAVASVQAADTVVDARGLSLNLPATAICQTLYFWRALRTKSLVEVRASSILASASSGSARDSTRKAVAGPSSGIRPLVE